MKEQKEPIVSYDLAKLAKEKGFDWECYKCYDYALTSKYDEQDGYSGSFGWKKGELNLRGDYFVNNYNNIDYSNKNWYMCAAPTQSLLQKWLRDVHDINIFMNFKPNIKKWDFIPYSMNINGKEYVKQNNEYLKLHRERRYDTYEEALEEGLKEALNKI